MAKPVPVNLLTSDQAPTWLRHQPPALRRWAEAHGFDASAGSTLVVSDAGGGIERVLVGLGEAATLHGLAPLAGMKLAAPLELEGVDWDDPATQRLALGFRLAAYRFDRYKQRPAAPELIWPGGPAGEELAAVAAAVCRVRDLVNTPAEDMGPEELATAAWELGKEHGAHTEIIIGEQLLERDFPAIHAVGRAAGRAPRLIDLSWGEEQHPTLVLVGKGVCFDSGGLNIKGAGGMRLMKKDMGGAAHVLGLAQLVMGRALPVRLRVLIPAVENAISGNAYRPGDVIRTRAGKTIEIGNTDAEGRVVLADALDYGGDAEPDLMIDFATLTGAARVALGPDLPPVYTDDEALADAWAAAAAAVEDPVWRMPLWDGYEEFIDTPVADVANSATSPMGGSITAALFLRRFVRPGIPWSHLDVYAWNPKDRPGRPQGGEAQGLRAAWELLRRRYGD